MVTTTSPSPSPDRADLSGDESTGFFPSLVKSVFEPGANAAVVLAMNISFFLLLIVLFALALLTSWNTHVLMMLGVTSCLWVAMMWFVMEISKMQNRPDNMPLLDTEGESDSEEKPPPKEPRKDR